MALSDQLSHPRTTARLLPPPLLHVLSILLRANVANTSRKDIITPELLCVISQEGFFIESYKKKLRFFFESASWSPRAVLAARVHQRLFLPLSPCWV